MNKKWKRVWKEAVVVQFNVLDSIFLEGLKKATEKFGPWPEI